MSIFHKSLAKYRQGNWRENFDHVNLANVEPAIRKILTTKEGKKYYDRLGNLDFTDKNKLVPLSLDEQIFRLCVLLDTQIYDALNDDHGYAVAKLEGRVFTWSPDTDAEGNDLAGLHPEGYDE